MFAGLQEWKFGVNSGLIIRVLVTKCISTIKYSTICFKRREMTEALCSCTHTHTHIYIHIHTSTIVIVSHFPSFVKRCI
jgi:hypothetical protein